MDKIIQFTYSYTRYKCNFAGRELGDGIYRMTQGGSADSYATSVMSNIRQNFPERENARSSFGYLLYDSFPILFRAGNRGDEYVISDRPGTGPYYMAHVTMGKELIENAYAIEYCDGNLKNTIDFNIDDSKTPEYYSPLNAADIEAGKNRAYKIENIRSKQKRHLTELALLADALVQALETNQRVFICAKSANATAISDWMAQLLMLFPKSIANRIGFNTYMPDPIDTGADFVLCGAISGCSENLDRLSDYGFVFEVGETILTQYKPRESSDLYRVLSLCDETRFAEWIDFVEEYSGTKEITLEEFLFATSSFRVSIDADWDVHDKIRFLNANYKSPYNSNAVLQKQFMAMSEDYTISNQLFNDPTLAYLFVESMRGIVNDASINVSLAQDIMEKIFFYMLECEQTAHYIFERVVDTNCTLDNFFGTSARRATQYLLQSSELVKNAVENNFYLVNTGINKRVLLCLIKVYMPGAFARGGVERDVMNLCAATLIRQNGLEDLLRIVREANDSNYVPAAQFLLELKNDNEKWYLIEEDEFYCRRLFEIITADNRYDQIIERYINSRQPNEKICRFLLKYKWNDENLTLQEILNVFENREQYRTIKNVFEERFIQMFENRFDKALDTEMSTMTSLTSMQLEEKKNYIEKSIAIFRTYNGNTRIVDFSNKLQAVLERINYYIANARRGEVSKETRIKFVCRKLYQIPPKAIRQLLREYDMEITGEDDGADFMQKACVKVERFLKKESTQETSKIKISFCDQLDKAVEKHRASYAMTKSVADVSTNLIIGLIIMGIFAVAVSIVSGILFASLAGGYFSLMYKVFPAFGIIYSGVMFYYNGNIPQRSKRIVVSVLEALCLVVLMLTVYHCFALLI